MERYLQVSRQDRREEMTNGEQNEERTPQDVIGAAKDCLRSGRKLIAVIGMMGLIRPIRLIHRLTQPPAAAIFLRVCFVPQSTWPRNSVARSASHRFTATFERVFAWAARRADLSAGSAEMLVGIAL
jgi:hypothetical protein